uniref:Radial spoke protein 1 n=1 Tax=Tetraselmis sp. GSL018 TaxID=582737 RepID=A0A061SGK3_9CHLO
MQEESWGRLIHASREGLKELPGVDPAAIKWDPEEAVDIPEKAVDFDLEKFACTAYGLRDREERAVKKVRIDIGWSFIRKKKAEAAVPAGEGDEDEEDAPEEEEEEEEPPDMDLNCSFYDAKGEEIQVINFDSREGEGASLSGDDTVQDPDKVTAHESDRIGFPVDESIFVDFRLIPKKTKNIVVGVTNYSGGGFARVKKLYCRIVDITQEKDPAQWRDVFVFHTDVKECTDPSKSGLIIFKLFKESKASKYWEWKKTADGGDVLGGLLSAEKPLKESLELLIEEQQVISGQDLDKEDEEEEEEEPEDDEDEEGVIKDDPDAVNWNWRVRAMNMFVSGENWEEAAEDVATAATFEGERDEKGWRCDPCSKAVYNNGDIYYGGYINDRRSGKGVYVFANKGAYAGCFKNGLRSGYGMMWYPDGSIYEGQWHKDKMWGIGQYDYADGSTYCGKWKEGKKHGSGVYWDKHGACLTGTWEKGILQGEGIYDTEAFQLVADFKKGIPVGDVIYTLQAHRTKNWRQPACKFILAEHGPTLTHGGSYSIPPGADADLPEGEDEPVDDDAPRMPKHPDYNGLKYVPHISNPEPVPDIPFPGDKIRPSPLKEKKYSDVRLNEPLPPPTFSAPPPPPPADEDDE